MDAIELEEQKIHDQLSREEESPIEAGVKGFFDHFKNINLAKLALSTAIAGMIGFGIGFAEFGLFGGATAQALGIGAGLTTAVSTAAHSAFIEPMIAGTINAKDVSQEAKQKNTLITKAKKRVSNMFDKIKQGNDPIEAVQDLYKEQGLDISKQDVAIAMEQELLSQQTNAVGDMPNPAHSSKHIQSIIAKGKAEQQGEWQNRSLAARDNPPTDVINLP